MNKMVLYAGEVVTLLAFWTYMFRVVKPSISIIVVLFVVFAAVFTLLDKHFTSKQH